jgi:L-ascorbate metabolism protein UlaG (beta-lactamase superfamily)
VKKIILLISVFLFITQSSCNLFYVAVRNVPVFFTAPRKVHNKIKKPLKENVRLSALWVGHATVLLQMDDKVIITDPVFSETVGELGRRVIEPGINETDIPKCDMILISHSHFDHLNLYTLEMMETRSSRSALVFPAILENYIPGFDYEFVKMSNNKGYINNYFGEKKMIKDIEVTSVFAKHWGGRYGLDGYLWGEDAYTGYIIQYNGMTVYFAGDTGYDSVKFKQIGEKYNIDLALIPIGPCIDCNQPGVRNHVFPPDAIMIFKDIKAKKMIPIHYGTFYFAQGYVEAPIDALNGMLEKDQVLKTSVDILKIGEQKIYLEK